MAELFYTNNGVPISEDTDWDYAGRYNVKTVAAKDKFSLQTGYKTASLHINRENRFYADLGFDGAVWSKPNTSFMSLKFLSLATPSLLTKVQV